MRKIRFSFLSVHLLSPPPPFPYLSDPLPFQLFHCDHLPLRSQTPPTFSPSDSLLFLSDSKQPKLEPKLVSALSETKRLFGLFRFYTETESFDVSKQTEDQLKQFDREQILLFFTENVGFFRFFFVFSFFSVCFETVCFGCLASLPKQRVSMFRLNRNKRRPTQTV
jgi:hypothetical protein